MNKIIIDKSRLATLLPVLLGVAVLVLLLSVLPQDGNAQIRAGSGYLKMLHGARDVGMQGTLSGALDHTYSFYANPAATGFMREWQWSATYTNWISDVYNASFLVAGKLSTPWSRKTRIGLGVNYLGIPEFNNTDDQATMVSGNNLLVTASIGQPLNIITRHLSIGANVKFFQSKLAGYETRSAIFDAGALLRSPRIALFRPFFDYLIFSTGISITNMGKPVTFISEETPLPRTIRGGAAVNIGAHHGLQFSIGADYREIRDEDGYFTCAAEISWRQLISLRTGYSWEDNLLGNYTFGGSIRLDDQIFDRSIAGQNNALRMDLATIQNNDYFTSPYHGTMTHQPIGPERFQLIAPAYDAIIDTDNVILTWESTNDPDLYDDCEQWICVDQDSSRLANVLTKLSKSSHSFPHDDAQSPLLVSQAISGDFFPMENLKGGDYFWCVYAYDKDNHIRFGEMKNRHIAKFHITAPDPKVIAIDFNHSEWITKDDYQGVLSFRIKNAGDRVAKNFVLSVSDSLLIHRGANTSEFANDVKSLIDAPLQPLAPREETIIDLDWRTDVHGLHQINTRIVSSKAQDEIIDSQHNEFYTIPKGYFLAKDTTIVQDQYHIIYQIPYMGKIFFDTNDATVKSKFIDDWVIEPPLAVFARRLKENRAITISLQGTIDPNSNETDLTLTDQRAAAVRDTLIKLGVQPEQIKIDPGIKLEPRKRPRNELYAKWAYDERRRVDIVADEASERIIFKPLQKTFIRKQNEPAPFTANITSFLKIQNSVISLTENNGNSAELNEPVNNSKFAKIISWDPGSNNIEKWLNNAVAYSLVLTDSLNRKFKTRPGESFLTSQITGSEKRYFIPAIFESTEAFYKFYWDDLIAAVPDLLKNLDTKIHFIGHGCATGSTEINNRLSKKRASDFQEKFKRDIGNLFPDLSDQIAKRLDQTEGKGEYEPFSIETDKSEKILIGDNETPLGRNLNRRVMILFYSSE